MNSSEQSNTPRPRRELILGGLATVAALFISFIPFKPAVKKEEKIKLLSENGQLIEVDASVIAGKQKRKISNEELRGWIKEK